MQSTKELNVSEMPAISAAGNFLSHTDEIRLAGLIATGKVARVELATGRACAADGARLDKDIGLAQAARTEFLLRNQGLVGMVARRYFETGLTHEDHMQEGQIGLLKAIDRYDPAKGTRFSTFAVWWIWQAIGRAVANTGSTIRLPANVKQKTMQLRRTETALMQQLGRTPNQAEVAQRLGWTVAQVRSVAASVVRVESVEDIAGNKGEPGSAWQPEISDASAAQPENEAGIGFLKKDIAAALDFLTPQEAAIVRMRFGFAGNEMYSLSAVSAQFGMSREGIRQVEARALGKLRKSPYANRLRGCYGDLGTARI